MWMLLIRSSIFYREWMVVEIGTEEQMAKRLEERAGPDLGLGAECMAPHRAGIAVQDTVKL